MTRTQDLKPIIKQTEALFNYGTIQQINSVKVFLTMLIQSIELRNEDSFDTYLRNLSNCLKRCEEQNKLAVQIEYPKEIQSRDKAVIVRLFSFLKTAFYKAAENVIVFLIVLIVLSLVIAGVLWFTGFNLTQLPAWNSSS